MQLQEQEREKQVFTTLGKGRVVHQLQDGTLVVEFEHGGGHIFRPEEIFDPGAAGGEDVWLQKRSRRTGS
jgi:hypothetical protein